MLDNKNTHQEILSLLHGRLGTNVLSRQNQKNHSVELSGKVISGRAGTGGIATPRVRQPQVRTPDWLQRDRVTKHFTDLLYYLRKSSKKYSVYVNRADQRKGSILCYQNITWRNSLTMEKAT
jgi:hypothetical protein